MGRQFSSRPKTELTGAHLRLLAQIADALTQIAQDDEGRRQQQQVWQRWKSPDGVEYNMPVPLSNSDALERDGWSLVSTTACSPSVHRTNVEPFTRRRQLDAISHLCAECPELAVIAIEDMRRLARRVDATRTLLRRTCIICGADFYPGIDSGRYLTCGATCAQANKRAMHRQFREANKERLNAKKQTLESRAKRNTRRRLRYATDKHYRDDSNAKSKAWYLQNRHIVLSRQKAIRNTALPPKPYNVTCLVCGTSFIATRKLTTLCSTSCRDERRRMQETAAPKNRKKGPFSCECATCGGVFSTDTAHSKTCSSSCKKTYNRLRQQQLRRRSQRQMICIVCSNYFTALRSDQVTCQPSCQKVLDKIKANNRYKHNINGAKEKARVYRMNHREEIKAKSAARRQTIQAAYMFVLENIPGILAEQDR